MRALLSFARPLYPLRVFLSALVLLACALPLTFSAEESAPPGELPKLDGILHLSKESYALFRGYDPSGHRWAVIGDYLGDFIVEKIRGSTVVLRGPDKQRHEVYATGWRTLEKRQQDPQLAEAWINSDENPMLWHPVAVPVQLQIRLGDLSPEEKYALQEWYLGFGWRMSFVIDAFGYWDIGFEHAFSDTRERHLNTRIARFRASLSPEQARTYTELTKALSYEQYRATRDERARRMAAFIETLTPGQRRAFEALQNVDGGGADKR